MQIKNLTPHVVRMNDGREFPPAGPSPRVSTTHSAFDADGVCSAEFGAVTGLPAPEAGVLLVVSGMVAQAARRADVVAPATGHPACVRKDGQVYSVPGFVRG
jgi:hypothetical protein